MNILFCPCHYVFDDGDRGSELSWAYQIAHRIAFENPNSEVVTGFKNTKKKIPFQVTEIQPYKKEVDLSLINSLIFTSSYSLYGLRVLQKKDFTLLHHVLPFGIDRTFNLAFFFSKLPKVIGPIQNQLPVFVDNIHDVSANKRKKHIILFERVSTGVFHPILRYLSNHTLKKADAIIVINEKTKKLLITRNINPNKIVIIPPGIDCKNFTGKRKTSKSKTKPIEILAVGALMQRKGFDVMLQGFASVAKTNNNFILRIVGDGPKRNYLEDLAKELGLSKFVSFEGLVPHSEMSRYYEKADIFVNMSRAEGFATVCLEAMASELAIISSRVGGFEEAIADGINGYIVEQEDYKKLAKRVVFLLNNTKELERVRRRARLDAVKYYDWNSSIIPQYKAIYNSLTK